MKIFITGSSGYIGGMLVDRFSENSAVTSIVALDMVAPPSSKSGKISYITCNLADPGWEEKVLTGGAPDIVIHCAYVIREGYGQKRNWQIKCNITSAERVFDFVFKNKIPRLIHFSTAASYGALSSNSTSKKFREEDPLSEAKYLYGVDKKIIEEKLQNFYEKSGVETQVAIIRPCAVTGPRGQFIFKRFGLLQMVKYGLPIVPITGPDSARQYVHEDDLWEAVRFTAFGGVTGNFEIFNLAPDDFLLLKDIAKNIGKVSVRVPMWLGKLAFGALWHLSRGRIPTVPAGINSFTYPIIIDGSKITRFGFKYQYSSKEALKADCGYYS
ncbi:hypothetical protein A3B05_01540 [Candidatus Giovannonibacteria bacterium RIFCSPLOWO2_01_FULL_43_160]|uniref:NAD-dependent epimerase/dehydratase n=2 Tax=Candidatus Giovannoniibacteriota TaxID=1752738 RepID=A0A0G1IVM1_9BACT|nr:MAG: NAD-dependent epimerase/dehydratase [Candidatus Giovannonibacteria bacterium GW2011_GWB1_43_13]KKS99552.1 MAG: NAD-dependent epimerase/dehydratase [Candidatus Giovannonibacteria bacterium GW2011_GWA1_43_15]KKT20677.1 MAG: NAD-dependent epimerase/dehydratase [Candidatus Giovannonibacteria bacterium GW2011_GWC2_43_8]KKT63461.1 MAG: NAD-dependent epimerase/dehydratase [Candidatus Giovannonibacteria bacterium GW2011_GWA2_44_26]OGF58115.1 MAG: hypothetical protein A2652_02735 [Candidatus Gio